MLNINPLHNLKISPKYVFFVLMILGTALSISITLGYSGHSIPAISAVLSVVVTLVVMVFLNQFRIALHERFDSLNISGIMRWQIYFLGFSLFVTIPYFYIFSDAEWAYFHIETFNIFEKFYGIFILVFWSLTAKVAWDLRKNLKGINPRLRS